MAKINGNPKHVYHLHWPLVVYIGVSLLIAVGAFHSQNNLLFWLFGLSMGLIVVSGMISGAMMMGVRIERQRLVGCRVGEALEVRYIVTNRNRFTPLFALTITEIVDAAKELPTGHAGVFTRRASVAAAPVGFASYVPARGESIVSGVAWTNDWGRLSFTGIQVTTAFPFGIIRKSLRFTDRASIILSPAKEETAPLVVMSGRGSSAESVVKGQTAGQGDEFFGVREFVPGDSPRIIAWKRSATLDRLLVRQWAGSAPGRVFVALHIAPDASAKQIDGAISAAVGAVESSVQQQAAVGLMVPWAGVARPPRPGRANATSVIDTLSLLRVKPELLPPPRSGSLSPSRLAPGDRVLVVHAGHVDASLGPRGAIHVQIDADGQVISGPVARSRAAPAASGNRSIFDDSPAPASRAGAGTPQGGQAAAGVKP